MDQAIDHALDFLKGWPQNPVVDYVSQMGTNVPANLVPIPAGRVGHLNSSGLIELGAVGTEMAIFLIQGSADFDVNNIDSNSRWYPIMPSGDMSGLVARGSYELQTTEYDTTATYAPNDLLHSPTIEQITSGTDKSMAGLIYKTKTWPGGATGAITQYTDNVCGVVSAGAGPNAANVKVLSFWPWYLPGATSSE